MPAYKKKKSGQWIYRKWVLDWRGEKIRITGTPPINTRTAAEAAERAHIARVQVAPAAGSEKREVPTLRDFVEKRWLPKYPAAAGNATTTRRMTEVHLRVQILPLLGDMRLDVLRGEVLEGWLATIVETPSARTGKTLRPKSVKNVVGVLNVILGKARDWGDIAETPTMPPVKVPRRSYDWLAQEDAARVLEACASPEERLLILFALRTGARAGEQRVLEWGDIDWNAGKVTFRRSMAHMTTEVKAPKSGRARTVPLAQDVLAALKAARGLQHLQGGLVFQTEGARWELERMRYVLHRACRRAGVREVRWHDLRHSFASQLVSAGVSLRQVQEWLGHSTITMTERYAHLAPDQGGAINVLCAPVLAQNGHQAGIASKTAI